MSFQVKLILKINFCVRVRLGVGFSAVRDFLLMFLHIFILLYVYYHVWVVHRLFSIEFHLKWYVGFIDVASVSIVELLCV